MELQVCDNQRYKKKEIVEGNKIVFIIADSTTAIENLADCTTYNYFS